MYFSLRNWQLDGMWDRLLVSEEIRDQVKFSETHRLWDALIDLSVEMWSGWIWDTWFCQTWLSESHSVTVDCMERGGIMSLCNQMRDTTSALSALLPRRQRCTLFTCHLWFEDFLRGTILEGKGLVKTISCLLKLLIINSSSVHFLLVKSTLWLKSPSGEETFSGWCLSWAPESAFQINVVRR